jgi:hypothetical protein
MMRQGWPSSAIKVESRSSAAIGNRAEYDILFILAANPKSNLSRHSGVKLDPDQRREPSERLALLTSGV